MNSNNVQSFEYLQKISIIHDDLDAKNYGHAQQGSEVLKCP